MSNLQGKSESLHCIECKHNSLQILVCYKHGFFIKIKEFFILYRISENFRMCLIFVELVTFLKLPKIDTA